MKGEHIKAGLEIFLTVKDLQHLIGYSCYNSAQRKHKEIRRKMGKVNSKNSP